MEPTSTTEFEQNLKSLPHHQQLDLCKQRPAYRQGRKLTAVKVYTIANESQHLFVYGVPKINLRQELKVLCQKYGNISSLHVVTDHETEIFTECYHLKYDRIQSARIAKKLLDNKSFYGGILHVCYAPEYESVEETKRKLLQRNKDVLSRLPNVENTTTSTPTTQHDTFTKRGKKRKLPVISASTKTCQSSDVSYQESTNKFDQDVILTCDKKLKYDVTSKNTVYGPQLPSDTSNEELQNDSINDISSNVKFGLVPSTVMKTNKLNVVKRIVFKNK